MKLDKTLLALCLLSGTALAPTTVLVDDTQRSMTMNFTRIALAVGSAIGAQKAIKTLQHFDVDDVLGTIGLERRRTAAERLLPALGLIGLSAAVGAGAALLLAPSSGKELRNRISGRIDDARNRIDDAKTRLQQKVSDFEREQLSAGNSTTI